MFVEYKQLFHWRRAVRNGREIAYCKRLIAGVMLFTASSVAVEAAPTGGQVTHGSADISQTTVNTLTHTEIDQSSQRVDIDWTGFDTLSNERVDFLQPNDLAVAINRISGNRTRFDGILNANGRIFLINQNGITFGSDAQINAGSLLATTADTARMDDEEMLQTEGQAQTSYVFDGTGYAEIVNAGSITVSDGGFAVLAAPYVENTGYIKADLGQVELASTNDYTLNVDLRGDGLITFSTAGEWLDDETRPLGATSTGTLQARSGHVYLSANMASAIVEGAVNLSGIVDADQFVATANGGTAMTAAGNGQQTYPGGTIKVESTGDINIGSGAAIHAVGGETVAASFQADHDINMGADGDPATITLKAYAAVDGASLESATAHASARLEMSAAREGGAGTLTIAGGAIEVTADATGTTGSLLPLATAAADTVGTTATASVVLEGAAVDIDADIAVHARAETLEGGYATTGSVSDNTDALAVLDVIANGEIELDTSGNVIRYGAPGDLTLAGDIDVSAGSTTVNAATSKATANAVLMASGSTSVTGDIDVDAVAVSTPGLYPGIGSGAEAADANAALLMLGGTPPGLLDLLREVSLNRINQLGTLSDMLTLANLDDVLAVFGSLLNDPVAFVNRRGGIGSGSVSYTGDSNVSALADFGTTGAGEDGASGLAEATAAGYFVAGGDVFINTDPVRVDSRAYTDVDDPAGASGTPVPATEARSFLVAAAGLGDLLGNSSNAGTYSTLTVLGDLSARAQEQASLNGVPDPATYNQLAAALTTLLASGDITVRGADPLADAAPAAVQGRSSQWQLCYLDQCTPVSAGVDGLMDLAAASAGNSGLTDSAHLAQLIIESLHGAIDIRPKTVTAIQPAGLFTDPVGPIWPGDLPLRFAADGRMLVATGADATRPPRMIALDSSIESAILAGADPSTLLPPTASGGCVAARRDAYTVSSPDYFDRMISASCESTD